MDLNLPIELIEFLKSNSELKYDPKLAIPGKVILHKLEHLKTKKLWIDASEDNKKAYYELEVVNLIRKCEGFDAFGILCWIPNLKNFASWDTDHWVLTLFPNATWDDICRDPISYLNAEWDENSCGVGIKYDPSETYPLIIGWPI